MKIKDEGFVTREVKKFDRVVQETVHRYTCGNYEIATFQIVGDPETFTRYIIHQKDGAPYYTPDIYHVDDFTGETYGYFVIQTASYGGLRGYEFCALQRAMAHALKVYEALTDYFIKGVR